jgi:four helix bundle protein
MLAHEKLHVYGKALAFVAATSAFSADWSKRHAVVDQLDRALDSLILNLAEGARFRSGPTKLRALDYALGSGFECAACLDIASVKGLVLKHQSAQQKESLSEIVRMLIGLRKAWENWNMHDKAHEEPLPYQTEPLASAPLFHHETLEVYRTALGLMVWLVSLPGGQELTNRVYRQIDDGVTSLILNIAEGNGRYSELDHRHFLDIAEGSAVKTAAYLDLTVQKHLLDEKDGVPGKALLERILAMLSRM